MSELQIILNIIKKTSLYLEYTEYNLRNPIYVDDTEIKNTINNLNKQPNTECYYNGKTRMCDVIGVVDINNKRIIDFDDIMYTLTNKGIDRQTNDFID